MRAYSMDLRVRVLAAVDAGSTYAATARTFRVSAEWVRRLHRRREATGEVGPRARTRRHPPFHRRHEAELRAAVAEQPDRTLEQLRQHLGLDVSIGTLWHALHALKISFKKSLSGRPSRIAPTFGRSAPSGTHGRPASTPIGSSSWTRRG